MCCIASESACHNRFGQDCTAYRRSVVAQAAVSGANTEHTFSTMVTRHSGGPLLKRGCSGEIVYPHAVICGTT